MELPSSFLIGVLIAIVLIISSFSVGYKIVEGINSLHGKKKGLEIYNEIKGLVDYLYYQAEGSSKIITIYLPSYDTIVCFINSKDVKDFVDSHSYLRDYDAKYLREVIPEENAKSSIPIVLYYHKRNQPAQVYKINHLIPDHTFCFNKTAQLFLENEGSYINVTLLK